MPQLSCVLSLACGWDSKRQILKDWAWHGPIPSSRGQSRHTMSMPFCPRESHTPARMPRFYGEAQQKAATRLFALCAPLSPANEQPLKGACRVFCPWRGNITSFICTPGRLMFSPSATQGILYQIVHSQACALLLPRSTCSSPILANVSDL